MIKNLFGLTLEQLQSEMQSIGQKKFRAGQIAAWIYQRGVHSFDDMNDLSKELRARLSEIYSIDPARLKSIEQRSMR